MSPRTVKGLLAAVFFSVTGFACTSSPAPTRTAEPALKSGPSNKAAAQQMEGIFGAVTEIARNTYIDPERSGNDEVLTTIALKALISSLDPHSEYMTQQDFEKGLEEGKGKFGGIGTELGLDKDKNIIVIDTMDDSPAQKAGLKRNDVLIKVKNISVIGADLNQTTNLIRGVEGSNIMLTVRRPGVDKPMEFNIVRAIIKTPAIKTAAIGNDIAYIRLSNFMQDNLTAEFEKAVTQLNTKMGSTLSSYIIDLRNNGGGHLNDAVNIAADLLNTDKTIVSTRGRNPTENRDRTGTDWGHGIVDLTHGKPIVLLVDDSSASASEVLTGALQDLAPDRVTVMGDTTFGKGLVQSVLPLRSGQFDGVFAKHGVRQSDIPGGAIKLTIAHYFTPSGRSIHNIGVPPNIQFIPNVTRKSGEPEVARVSEAALASGLSRPDNAKEDKTQTTKSCTPHLDVKVSDGYNKILKNKDGYVYPEILCGIEWLRGTKQWTNFGLYTPPAAKAPAPSPVS